MRLRSIAIIALVVALLLRFATPAGGVLLEFIIDRGPDARAGQTALISVVGDSLAYGSAPSYDKLTQRFSLALDARVGRNTAGAASALDRTRAAQADVVIIALGTNDQYNAFRYRQLVADALAHINPVAQLVWVLPHRWHPAMDEVRAATVDELRSRPRTIILDDEILWSGHPEYRAGDGIHLTASGYLYRASVLGDATFAALDANAGFAARSGGGYWSVRGTGEVAAFVGAPHLGGAAAMPLNRPIVGMAPTPTGAGYWLVSADGGIFSFGDAVFYGSTAGIRLNRPILGMSSTPSGAGYWLVAADGGVFTFGDAVFNGSLGSTRLQRPVTSMASSSTGGGYWLVAADGGVFAFGDAPSLGSAAGSPINAPVVGITPCACGNGYWLVATDGGVFTYGPGASFYGSTGDMYPPPKVIGLAARSSGAPGYVIVGEDGGPYEFGPQAA